jgi:hypothetical protein
MKEALCLALWALDSVLANHKGAPVLPWIEARDAVKAALEAKDEPVAWGVFEGNLHDVFFSQEEAQEMADLKGTHAEVRPLYTTPPQRTWVGLTNEETIEIELGLRIPTGYRDAYDLSLHDFAKTIEAKLRSKNNG